jgi:hypothetical protein
MSGHTSQSQTQQSISFDLDLWLLNYHQSGIDDTTIWTRHESSSAKFMTNQHVNAQEYHSALVSQLTTSKTVQLDWAERIWNTWSQRQDHPTIAAYKTFNEEPLELAVIKHGIDELRESREQLHLVLKTHNPSGHLFSQTLTNFETTLTTLQSLIHQRQKSSLELGKAKRERKLNDLKMHETVHFVLQCLDNQRDLADTILGKSNRLLREGFDIVKAVLVEVFGLPLSSTAGYDVAEACNNLLNDEEQNCLSNDWDGREMIDDEAEEDLEMSDYSSEEKTAYHRTAKRQKRGRNSDDHVGMDMTMTEAELELEHLRSLHARHQGGRHHEKPRKSLSHSSMTSNTKITRDYLPSPPTTPKTPGSANASKTTMTPLTPKKLPMPKTTLRTSTLLVPVTPTTPTKSLPRRSPRFLNKAQCGIKRTIPKAETWANHLRSLRTGRESGINVHDTGIEGSSLQYPDECEAETGSCFDRESAKHKRPRLIRKTHEKAAAAAAARSTQIDADTKTDSDTNGHLDGYEDIDGTYTTTTKYQAAESRLGTKKRKRRLIRGLKEHFSVDKPTATRPQDTPTRSMRNRRFPSVDYSEKNENVSMLAERTPRRIATRSTTIKYTGCLAGLDAEERAERLAGLEKVFGRTFVA